MTNSIRFLFLTAAIAVGASSGFHITPGSFMVLVLSQ
jgi:hypothetical protein